MLAVLEQLDVRVGTGKKEKDRSAEETIITFPTAAVKMMEDIAVLYSLLTQIRLPDGKAWAILLSHQQTLSMDPVHSPA